MDGENEKDKDKVHAVYHGAILAWILLTALLALTFCLALIFAPKISRTLSRVYEKLLRDFMLGLNRPPAQATATALVITSVIHISTVRTLKVTTVEKDIVETTQDAKTETKTTSIPIK